MKSSSTSRRLTTRVLSAMACLMAFGMFSVEAAPDNDFFANRQLLVGDNVSFGIYHLHATRELEEPRHAEAPYLGFGSVWWRWIAPANGFITLTKEYGPSELTLYTGSTLGELQPLFQTDGQVRFPGGIAVVAGEEYQVAATINSHEEEDDELTIDGRFLWGEEGVGQLRFHTPSENGRFAQRQLLEGNRIHLAGTVVNTSAEQVGSPSQPRIVYGAWWTWTPAISGVLSVSGGAWPGRFVVYRGDTLETLVPLDTIEEVEANVPLTLVVQADSPVHPATFDVLVTVSPMRPGAYTLPIILSREGPFQLRITDIPPEVTTLEVNGFPLAVRTAPDTLEIPLLPAGRHHLRAIGWTTFGERLLSRALPVLVQSGTDHVTYAPEVPIDAKWIGGDVLSAQWDPFDPPYIGLPELRGGSIWWRFTAPAQGRVLLGPAGVRPGVAVASYDVFTGSNAALLQPLAPLGPWGWQGLEQMYEVSPNQTLWIRLFLPASGNMRATWAGIGFHFQPRSAHQLWAQALPLQGPTGHVDLAHDYAEFEPNEPHTVPDPPFANGSRWYRWEAPDNGLLFVSLTGHDDYGLLPEALRISAWTATPPFGISTLELISGPDLQMELPLFAGQSVWIRVVSPNRIPPQIELGLDWWFLPTQIHQNPTHARVITEDSGVIEDSVDALSEDHGLDHLPIGSKAFWYKFASTHDGILRVRFERDGGQNFSPELAVSFFSGTGPGDLRWIPSQSTFRTPRIEDIVPPDEGDIPDVPSLPNPWDGTEWSVTDVTANEPIWIAVWPKSPPQDGPSQFRLFHDVIPRPGNDMFENPRQLTGPRLRVSGTNWNASADPGQPEYLGRSIWWRWTAPGRGYIDRYYEEYEEAPFVLFTGNTLESLEPVPSADSGTSASVTLGGVRYAVESGHTYFLTIPGRHPDQFLSRPNPEAKSFDLLWTSLDWVESEPITVVDQGVELEFEVEFFEPHIEPPWSRVEILRTGPYVENPVLLGSLTAAPLRVGPLILDPGIHQLHAIVRDPSGQRVSTRVREIRVQPTNSTLETALRLEGRTIEQDFFWAGTIHRPDEPAPSVAPAGGVWYAWTSPAGGTLKITLPSGVRPTLVHTEENNDGSIDWVVVPMNLTSGSYRGDVDAHRTYWLRLAGHSLPIAAPGSGTFILQLETVTLLGLNHGAEVDHGQPIVLSAFISDSAETIERVDWILDGEVVHQAFESPWQWTWENPTPGEHSWTIRAQLQDGAVSNANPRTFIVRPENNRWVNRIHLEGLSGIGEGSTLAAAASPPIQSSGVVWYEWKAPASSLLEVAVLNEGISVFVELYQGTNFLTLQKIPQLYPSPLFRSIGHWHVQEGTTYYVAFGTRISSRPEYHFTFSWELFTPPTNDDFIHRIHLDQPEGETVSNLHFATMEEEEPNHAIGPGGGGNTPIASAWWTWTPPGDGVLQVWFPTHIVPPTSLRAYAGTSLTNLTPIRDIPQPQTGPINPRLFPATSGESIHIALHHSFTDWRDLHWAWKWIPAPPNNRIANASLLEGILIAFSGTTVGASVEANEPGSESGDGNSVWWLWTPSSDGLVSFLAQDIYSTVELSVWLANHEENDEAVFVDKLFSGSRTPSTRVSAQESLLIRVSSGTAIAGPFELLLDFESETPPVNDAFADRIILSGERFVFQAHTHSATREFGEPWHQQHSGGRSVWYEWTPTRDGTLEIFQHPLSNIISPILAAYRGQTVQDLESVESTHIKDFGPLLIITVEAGIPYLIAADGGPSNYILEGFFTPQGENLLPEWILENAQGQTWTLKVPTLPPGTWSAEVSYDLVEWIPNGPVYGGEIFEINSSNNVFFRLRRD